MKKLVQSLFLFLLIATSVLAQNKKITGKVVAKEDGLPLPGVTVKVAGTNLGTQTDANGNYSINLPLDSKNLQFSFIGFVEQTLAVGPTNTLNVVLTADSKQLNEVIVTTALGIRKSARSTGYANQPVSGDDLTNAKVVNLSTGLQSKVSGLQINLINNGVTPSTRVVLRGNRSITGNNQALIVVDGVPVPSSVLATLNPNDVQSVNVLKGANAASLYGSEGVNGVLIVTTKTGSKFNNKVSFSSTTSLESVAYLPEMQYEFGNGYDLNTYVPFENTSWGPRYDGSIVTVGPTLANGDELKLPYSPLRNEKMDFWDTGKTYQNDLSFSGGDDKSTYYFSVQDVKTNGIIPSDESRRSGARLNASREFGKLTTSFNLNYVVQNTNVTQSNVYENLLNIPQNVPITQLSDWRNNEFANPNGYFSGYYVNPYWEIDNNRRNTRGETFTGNTELKYSFTKWLNATYRLGVYNTNSNYKQYYAKVAYTSDYDRPTNNNGSVTDRADNLRRINSDLLLQANKKFGDFNTSLLLGNNIRDNYSKLTSETANALVIDGLYNISNRVGEASVTSDFFNNRQVAAFAELSGDYKNFLFLTVTGRNEWVSLLNKSNRSYFYPGASLSFVFTDAIPTLKSSKTLTFGKAYVSANKTGNVNLGAYQLVTPFDVGGGFPYGTTPGFSVANRFSNPDLTPEFVKSLEGGIQLGFWNDRLNFEGTYAYSQAEGQIIPISTSFATGYSSAYVNAGRVDNNTVELALRGSVIRNSSVKWDVGINYTHYDNKVIELYQGLSEIGLGGYTTANVYAVKGEQYPVLKTTAYARDPDGRVIVNGTNGYPVQSSSLLNQGQTNPDQTVGFNTNISYKGFTLAGQLDYRTGNVFYNVIGNLNDFTGLSSTSAQYGRMPFVYPNSVIQTSPGVYAPNTTVKTQDGGFDYWYGQYRNVQENYTVDGSFLKLRELSLTYDLPTKFLANQKVVKRASIGLVGRNLFTWLPAENKFTDPEFNFTDGNAVGVSDYIAPPTRIFGLNLNITF